MTVMPTTVSIVIPLYNQLEYTKLCMESLCQNISSPVEIILVDNASSDGTAEYLNTFNKFTIITNSENLGFAGACNRGINATHGDWIIVLNNDVIVAPGWLEGMLNAAARWKLDMVTPAIREGEYNYDISNYSRELVGRMQGVIRRGKVNGICFMARRQVFETIGHFDENFRIGQYEDKDLFLRAANAGFKLGTVGSAFLHHFGSVTQNSLKSGNSVKPYALKNKKYFASKWQRQWWQRTMIRNIDKLQTRIQSLRERTLYGHTLLEKWMDGELHYF